MIKEKNTKNKKRLPDAINNSSSRNFTQIPNELLRNPDLTGKAKTILSILLSNKEGWVSYINSLNKMMKEGVDAIRTGIKELEEHKYLKRFRYRDGINKKFLGSFWAYTDIPDSFDIEHNIKYLESKGFELITKNGKSTHGKSTHGKSTHGKSNANNTNTEKHQKTSFKKNHLQADEEKIFPKNLNTSIKEISRKILNTGDTRNFSADFNIADIDWNDGFALFWELYPRKKNKRKTQEVWENLAGQPDTPEMDDLLSAILAQRKTSQWGNKRFISLPQNWLSGQGWLDDPAAMIDYSPKEDDGGRAIMPSK